MALILKNLQSVLLLSLVLGVMLQLDGTRWYVSDVKILQDNLLTLTILISLRLLIALVTGFHLKIPQ
jgi:hypothetical protein